MELNITVPKFDMLFHKLKEKAYSKVSNNRASWNDRVVGEEGWINTCRVNESKA